ncbi:MAG: hypothetical protein KJ726_11735, partial [Verrucomicrobia bacterium]|nr:hypothetical protein [Verrucomicrobiota bacterium]MBU1910708.1 hypothetical protein [Verrucomicrobiota bacterium]
MHGRPKRDAILLAAICLAAGCGGMQQGYFSMPYLGEPPRRPAVATTALARSRMQELHFPGLEMKVDLLNSVQMSDAIWFGLEFPMVPVRSRRSKPPPAGTNCAIEIGFKALESGIEFDPSLVNLRVSKKSNSPSGFELYRPFAGEWVAMPAGPVAFTNDSHYWFRLQFAIPRPSPNRDIRLDLDPALRHPGLAPFPVIRFLKKKWREPYS